MPPSGYGVRPAALTTHAGVVEQAAEAVAASRGSAHAISLGTSAYGMLMRWLPSLFARGQEAVIATLADVEKELRENAVMLRNVAAAYENADSHTARSYMDGGRRR
jgi:TctA family transporter